MTLMHEIGNDADLLTRSDEWLEKERLRTADALQEVANTLRAIQLAQTIKRHLQNKNLVAVQQILRTTNGDVKKIIIKIMSLPDALVLLAKPQDTLDQLNTAAQLHGWNRDGYDLATSAALRG